MSILLQTLLLGTVASIAMIASLVLIDKYANIRSSKVWIFGKLLSAKGWSAKSAESTVHILGGIFFAAAYILVWSVFDVPSQYYPIVGLFTGLIHGAGIAMTHLSILAFDEDGHRVSLVHMAAHCIFGLVIGTGVSIADSRSDFVEQFADSYSKPLFFAQQADATDIQRRY